MPSLAIVMLFSTYLMGGVKIENRENFGQCPNFNLGILKPQGGGLIFSEMSELKDILHDE